jgi:hypothetical protein
MSSTPDYDPNSINAVLSRMETLQKEDSLKLEAIKQRLVKGDERMDKQEERIQKLERWKYYVAGFSAAVGFALSLAWEWFTGKKH